jgi:hypothetical protein
MQKDVIFLGPAPAEEECAQIGDNDYHDRALRECREFITAIRKVCGEEPEGARLRVMREAHDFGFYLEVAIEYDGSSREAAEYASRCDERAPVTWDAADMSAPVARGRGR